MAGPTTLMPSHLEDLGVKAYNDVEKAVEGADVVMGLRIQLERTEEGAVPNGKGVYQILWNKRAQT